MLYIWDPLTIAHNTQGPEFVDSTITADSCEVTLRDCPSKSQLLTSISIGTYQISISMLVFDN